MATSDSGNPAEGDLPHVFGRVILSSDRSPHPVPFAPETLSVADGAPRTPVALQWSSVERAHTYRLEIVPVTGSGRTESFMNQGRLCGFNP